MDPGYKEKKDKYLSKIDKATEIKFTPNTLQKIKNIIEYNSFLKNVIKSNDISRGCSFNDELQIRIKIGDTAYSFIPYQKSLSTFNNISMVVELDELINNFKNGFADVDLSDDEKYGDIIQNAVILGYIFLLKLNRKIKFYSINKLNPVTKKIVQMVYEINKESIDIDSDTDEEGAIPDIGTGTDADADTC